MEKWIFKYSNMYSRSDYSNNSSLFKFGSNSGLKRSYFNSANFEFFWLGILLLSFER